jgi:hypothetical protein
MPAGGEGDFAPREGGDRNGNGDQSTRARRWRADAGP